MTGARHYFTSQSHGGYRSRLPLFPADEDGTVTGRSVRSTLRDRSRAETVLAELLHDDPHALDGGPTASLFDPMRPADVAWVARLKRLTRGKLDRVYDPLVFEASAAVVAQRRKQARRSWRKQVAATE